MFEVLTGRGTSAGTRPQGLAIRFCFYIKLCKCLTTPTGDRGLALSRTAFLVPSPSGCEVSARKASPASLGIYYPHRVAQLPIACTEYKVLTYRGAPGKSFSLGRGPCPNGEGQPLSSYVIALQIQAILAGVGNGYTYLVSPSFSHPSP